MERTIRVKGTGKAKAEADQVTLNFTLSTIDLEYEQAFNQMEKSQADFRSTMERLGFEKDSVKSTEFTVDENYESIGKREVFTGFEITHQMQVSFDFSSQRLAEVLSALKKGLANPSIQISFSTKDQDGLKKRILQNAVQNAREKAEIIAAASGCSLGEILNIDYSWEEVDFESDFRYCGLEKSSYKSAPMEINPKDIEAADTVSIIWGIK